ncbi:hypothetical protein [Blastopirellula marina]|uniref:Lipoprotein n=1 Tax=Blastopirellula marina DSM 3645 TaxID=314230 RepID=A3ZRH2_9BACT|nr:hypothetical protein [Blastopirellula marina]EAQ80741.1 hypothetical protein DSM3645_12011 [Blastopirellula marina DSM 3645]
MFARISRLVLLTILLAGCSADQPTPPAAGSAANAPAASPKSTEPELPFHLAPVGVPVPPLDGGRVKTNLPEGWKLLPRRSEYLLGAYEAEPSGIPRILAHVSDSPLADTIDQASGKVLYKTLAGEIGELTFADPPPKVMEIGSTFWVQYVRPAKFQSETARQLVLETVRNGRRYKLELFVAKDDLPAKASAAYRVANDTQFLSEQAEKPAAETEPEEPPAEAPASDDDS